MTHSNATDASSGIVPSAEAATPLGDVGVVLGRIPSGLFVVTWREAEADRAMLASWVMQAGFAPPSVSVAVAPSRGLSVAIDAGLPFVINMLCESQRGMLSRFGRPSAVDYDPFDGLVVERSPSGAAVLAPSSGWLECVGVSGASGSDHRVIIAVVRAAGGVEPLPSGTPEAAPIVHVRKNGLRY